MSMRAVWFYCVALLILLLVLNLWETAEPAPQGLSFALTQHQRYLDKAGRSVGSATISRGSSTTLAGCMTYARSWANDFRGYEVAEVLDGYDLRRPVALGTEVVTLRCERKVRP